jgi:hypothetical protein
MAFIPALTISNRRTANLVFPSLLDASGIIEAIWKGKIDGIRYKGMEVNYSSVLNTYEPRYMSRDDLEKTAVGYVEPLVVS